ncbi:hypothetical protein [Streptomyces sp. SID12501]|uniref:Uncharacterized protein n=1 Tax=Streptomyces sp. SID12501 TaxID=2706042 RepID=A0A6B3C4Q1_9ACTN|nr:hypothetical protein [Streptomyces sp. SID12501]NEC91713.1 hypothetical protein [Streptomyces sp. SID12501]
MTGQIAGCFEHREPRALVREMREAMLMELEAVLIVDETGDEILHRLRPRGTAVSLTFTGQLPAAPGHRPCLADLEHCTP